ncbi:MAG TPA: GGDEF domain-containing protein [Pseudonocardiaceae bacterium]
MAYILAVDAAALIAIAVGLTVAPIERSMLLPFGLLMLCSVAYTDASRSIEQIREQSAGGPHVDLNSVWMFAAVLLLHPALAAVVITTSYTYRWLRVRHHIVHRQTFSAAATILSGHLCYLLMVELGGSAFGHVDAGRTPVMFLLVAGAGVLFMVVNFALVSGAVALTIPNPQLKATLSSFSDYALEAATIALGILLAWALMDWPVAAVLVVGVTLVLHRNVLISQLRERARIDAKTGLLNAAAWSAAVDEELARTTRLGQPSGLLVIDLDHFKAINDRFGHLAGDQMLRAVASTLTNEVRTYDLVGRFGGEEFVVLLPATSETETLHVAERIRRRIEELVIPLNGSTNGSAASFDALTVSIGIAAYPRHGDDRAEVLHAADMAMYAAKAAGRNRVCEAAAVTE